MIKSGIFPNLYILTSSGPSFLSELVTAVTSPLEEMGNFGLRTPRGLEDLIRGETRAAPLARPARHLTAVCRLLEGRERDAARLFGRLPKGKIEDRELALSRLRHVMAHADPWTPRGTYAGFLARCVLEQTVSLLSVEGLEMLLEFMERGGSVRAFERFAAGLLPAPASTRFRWFRPDLSALQSLQLPPDLQRTLASVPENLRRTMRPVADLGTRTILEEAIRVSAESPMAFLRLRRIGQLLEEPDSPVLLRSKLGELADRQFRLMGRDVLPSLSRAPWKNSQRDGYFGDPRTSVILSGLERLWSAGDHDGMRAVVALREAGPVETATPAMISSVLHRLGDPISRRLAFVLDRGDVILQLLGPGEDISLDGQGQPAVISAHRIPWGPRRSTRNEDVLRDVLADIVRRYKVHEEFKRLKPHVPIDPWPIELRAQLEEVQWRATYGDRRLLKAAFEESPFGPALFYRDRLESAPT